MIAQNDLLEFDKKKMHVIYDQWPQIADNSYNSSIKPIDFDNINHIVFSGMGGSGTIGDIFSAILSKTNIHVNVTKGYLLPNTINKNTLIVTTSTSGNTTETLTTLQSAKDSNSKIIAFSSGGKMAEYCKQNNIDFRKIPLIHSPRASCVSFVYSILRTLKNIIPITEDAVNESIRQLQQRSLQISSTNLSDDNPAISIAKYIDSIPCIYYPHGLSSAAIRFKNSLQENSKMHVLAEDIIEACHNGIVPWEIESKLKPILIQGKDDFIKTKERWEIIKEYFNDHNIEFLEVKSVEGHVLTKIIDLIYLLDYTSIYKALISKIDPSPIYSIDYVKSKLQNL